MRRYFKRSLALILALMMAVSTMSVMAMATSTEDYQLSGVVPLSEVDSGTCGRNLTWVMDSVGTLTISGTGDMNYFSSYSNCPWHSYISSIQKVVIEEGVTNIASYSFQMCSNLEEVTIANTVTTIGSSAFSSCYALKGLNIPDSVTRISDWAFYGCTSLISVIIPDSVTDLGSSVFYSCSNLEEVTLSKNLTKIGSWTFAACQQLKKIEIPENVTSIGSYAFYSCSSLTAVSIPTSVTEISDNAFSSCSLLSTVYYGGSEQNWAAISIGSENSYLTNAVIHYYFSGVFTAEISISRLAIVSGSISITWETDPDAEGYFIFRMAENSGSGYIQIATISSSTVNTYADTNVQDGVTYYYYVQAYSGNFTSDYEVGKHITYQVKFVTEPASITPESSNNKGNQNYSTYGSLVYSYLETVGDRYMRVEYTGSNVTVEYYDKNFNITEKKYISCELAKFGGFYAGENAYYLAFGQSNLQEDDSQEVLRIVKYSKNWERLDQASLYRSNTYSQFDAGSLRMAEGNGYLYIRTCHTAYASSDGLHHQYNLIAVMRESDMDISYNVNGTVSHSFNQFVMIDDEDNVIALDHGDAYPRAMTLFKYCSKAGDENYTGMYEINVFTMQGDAGTNATGASIGGLEYSSSSYLVAGNSVTQDSNWNRHTARNIFITVTDRDQFSDDSTQIKWITNYDTDGSISASTPQLVKIGSDKFMLLWTTMENTAEKLHYVYLDGQGNTTSEIYTTDGALSDCQPVVNQNGSVVWYVTGRNYYASVPTFYLIDSNGKLSTQSSGFTGFAKDNGNWYYYENGVIASTLNDVIQGTVDGQDGWWYVVNGQVQLNYTGVANYANAYGWWYIKNGKVDFSCNSVEQNNYGWWYVTGGQVQFGYTGVSNYGNAYGYWYIKNGKVDFSKTGIEQNNYGWWRVVNGQVDFSCNSVEQNDYGWWYVVGGQVQFGYTGVSNYGNAYGYWYIKDGKVDFSKTSIEQNNYGWWRVVGGKVDFGCNSVEQNDYGWWYVIGGKVQFDYTGVANYANANGWWFISGGKVDFSKTSVEQNNYGWWRVENGKVNFSFTGWAKNSYGTWYCVNGKVDFSKS